jgi:hypothetical protein
MDKPYYLVIWTEMDSMEEFPVLKQEETDNQDRLAKLVDEHLGCIVVRDAVLCQVRLERQLVVREIVQRDPIDRAREVEEARRKKHG